ncbi:hypothetical protein HYU20_02625 [Candidatus Woesearchaeota archaeon]|nr:hypothetical protein [Candidatus Woesearchaeota archaeon]
MKVIIEGQAGTETRTIRSLADLADVVGLYISGHASSIEARSDGLVDLLNCVDDCTRCIPQGSVEAIESNRGSLPGLVGKYGIHAVTAIIAIGGSRYRSETAIRQTAEALSDFGIGPTIEALRQGVGPAREIYQAAKTQAMALAKDL